MTTTPTSNRPPARGRPRSHTAQEAILRAAYGLLKRKPLAAIATLEIARRAKVSTATIYRWWPTKEALLLDAAMEQTRYEPVLQKSGTPLARLRKYVLRIADLFTGETGIVVARLLAAIQDNSVLRREFVKRVLTPRQAEIRRVVQEAIAAGELAPGTDASVLLDSIVGPLLVRLLLRHARIGKPFVLDVFERAVAAQPGRIAARRP